MSGSIVQENKDHSRRRVFPFPRLCAVLLIGIKTMMTIIPEKSAYCCRWARKLGEAFYIRNCMGCFRNTASNFIGLVDRNSTSIKPLLSLHVLYPPHLHCGGAGEILLVCFQSRFNARFLIQT